MFKDSRSCIFNVLLFIIKPNPRKPITVKHSITSGDNLLDRIVLEFPEHKREIAALYNKSTDFIEVCEDYMVCINSIKELKKTPNLKDLKRMNDLEAASVELKDELIAMI